VIKNWKKYLIGIKCKFGKHEWLYSGTDVLSQSFYFTNQLGFFRFCPHCAKKQERHIFDLGRSMYWDNIVELTPEERRIYNLNQLEL